MAANNESKLKGSNSKRISHPKDEFFVRNENIALVMQYKDKVEQMYDIEISGEEKTDEGQWLIMSGEPVDRRNAKNYITAMCHPAERKQVQFPSTSELTNPETLEYIEKRTNAFIRPLKKIALFEITGSEYAVTLALSEIEELAGTGIISCDDASEAGDHDNRIIEISPSTNKGSSRLSDVLERALSSHSDGNCSVADYRNTCPSVQRVLVNCLQDEDEPEGDEDGEDCMFGDGRVSEEMKDVPGSLKPGSQSLNTRMYFVDSDSDEGEIVNKGLNEITEKMKDLKLAVDSNSADNLLFDKQKESSETKDKPLLSKQQIYLKSYGLSVGFEEHKVIKAVKFVDEKTRPSDFLDILNLLPEDSDEDLVKSENKKPDVISVSDNDDDAVIFDSETIEYVNDNNEVVVTTDTGIDNNGEKLELPEDENCSREELKRRNAERQQLLRQNFLRQQQNQGPSTNAKKKNKKKKKGNSGEGLQEKNDQDQTSVMKVWNIEKEPAVPEDFQFQNNQKKRNQNFSNLPNQASQQQGKFRQISPNRAQQRMPAQSNKKNMGPQNELPRKGNYKKPTQIVNPVNIPKLMDINTQPTYNMSESCELRYIVIDGSNVAMTHGNGKHFSCKGIQICVDYFRQRGHDKITVFVPQWRQYRPSDNNPILDQDILQELKDDGTLVFTPSRKIDHRLVASYDDRFVLELAEAEDGIIVSNDQYRDLMTEKSAWKKIIHERLLMYSFVRDRFMPPNDPLGRDGPCLDSFLKMQTYNDDPHNPRLMQVSGFQYQPQQYYKPQGQGQGLVQCNQGQGYNYSQGHNNFQGQNQGNLNTVSNSPQNQGSYARAAGHGLVNYGLEPPYGQQPPNYFTKNQAQANPGYPDTFIDHSKSPRQQKGQGHWKGKGQRIPRTEQESDAIFQELKKLFPDDDQEEKIKKVISNHLYEHDLEKLTNDCMNVLF